jgi:two-component sensor histidine kinase
MTETVRDRSPLASAKSTHGNRQRVRAAECQSRQLSSRVWIMYLGSPIRKCLGATLITRASSPSTSSVTAMNRGARSLHPLHLVHRSFSRSGPPIAPKIVSERAADTLRFRCPNTGREVDSGIGTDCGARLLSIRVLCPLCEDVHEWQVTGRNLDAVLSAEHQSNDARLNKAHEGAPIVRGRNPELIELREQFLEEMNQRLTNNLQVLYGLLKVAWRKTGNTETREVLSDTCRRIGAMGAAQEVFYSANDTTDVSGQRFLEAICANARAFFSKNVAIKYEAGTGSLPKEAVVPLALALNELLTNAAKHGTDHRGRSAINVGLRQRSGEIELYVQDRGAGFHLDPGQTQSSGLGLVATLVRRLRGSFTVERRSGARCVLRVPDQ